MDHTQMILKFLSMGQLILQNVMIRYGALQC